MTREDPICYTLAITLTICMMVVSGGFSQNTENAVPPLTDEDKRFDFDGDGRLSEDEKEILLETITQEALTGVRLDERAIREMRRGGGPGGFGGRGRGPRRAEKIVHRFDKDGDGKLNESERGDARKYVQDSRGAPGASRSSDEILVKTTLEGDLKTSKAAAISENVGLYNDNTLRTFYLRFHDDDWYEQLGDFYKTDVDVPADLVVDGEIFRLVGVRFRGSCGTRPPSVRARQTSPRPFVPATRPCARARTAPARRARRSSPPARRLRNRPERSGRRARLSSRRTAHC